MKANKPSSVLLFITLICPYFIPNTAARLSEIDVINIAGIAIYLLNTNVMKKKPINIYDEPHKLFIS